MKQINSDITFVTAFLDIGRKDWAPEFARDPAFYVESFLNYLNYPYKMVCYVDEKYYDFIIEKYMSSPYTNKHFISINTDWLHENIHAWSGIEKDRAIMEDPEYRKFIDGRLQLMYPQGIPETNVRNHLCPENLYPEYNAINHAKIDFIVHAIENGYIFTKFTAWCDFGYFRTYHSDGSSHPGPVFNTGMLRESQISLCLCRPIAVKDVDILDTALWGNVLFIGAFYAGATVCMKQFQILYHDCVEELRSHRITDDDQHIYIRCLVHNPELFDLKIFSTQDWPKLLSEFSCEM